MKFRSIVVFCGSNPGKLPAPAATAKRCGQWLARRHIDIVYGAGNIGLMGVLADAALAEGGRVIGVIPGFLKEKEVCHTGLSELHVVDSMHERKIIMARLSQAVLVLPGGYGTLDELFEMLTLVQLGQHTHPIGILNEDGFYAPLLQQLDHMEASGFLRPEHRRLILDGPSLEGLLERMQTYEPPQTQGKWLDLDRW